MSAKLILFKKEGSESMSYSFNIEDKLSQVRSVLESDAGNKFMTSGDYFLNQGSKVAKNQENVITLELLLNGESTVDIGIPDNPNPINPKDGVQSYKNLSDTQKNAIFNDVQIYNGLTFTTENGFKKTFEKLCTWSTLPKYITPNVVTEVRYTDSFSEVSNELSITSTDSASVSLDTPYGGGEAEYKAEKSKTTTGKKVTQYITGKYLVRKVALEMDLKQFKPTTEFSNAVKSKLRDNPDNNFAACDAIVQLLNKFGYYLPQTFNLGGSLYSTDSTTISEYSETTTNNEEFGGSFKAAFDGIGGGTAYKHAEGSSKTTTSSNKFQVTSFTQIGGKANTSNDFNKWAKSLDKAAYWGVATYNKLLPSIAILAAKDMDRIISLFNKFNSYPAIVELQPYIDLKDYATKVQSLFPSPWS